LLPELDCRFISTLVGEVGEVGEDAVEEALAVLDEEKVRWPDECFAISSDDRDDDDSAKLFSCVGQGDGDLECDRSFDAKVLKNPLVVSLGAVLFDGSSEILEDDVLTASVLVLVKDVFESEGIDSNSASW